MRKIIIKPIITEKSIGKTTDNKYCFEVHPIANKIEVEKAVKELYKVEVISVNIINKRSIAKIFRGKNRGKTKNIKKAYVTVKKGQKIPGFEVKEK